MKLILLRHGESKWNQENRFTGWTDVPLTEGGRREARYAGQLLKQRGVNPSMCYTSYLKRAIQTLNLVLEEMDLEWIPVDKDWRLNERHYGKLQGLDKCETAEKFGDKQVKLWRRSFSICPPILDKQDERNPAKLPPYQGIPQEKLPLGESLKDTSKRVEDCFKEKIFPEICRKKEVLLVAHGNSLRSLMMYLEHLTPEQILDVNLPTAVPLIYELDSAGRFIDKKYLGNPKRIREREERVAAQGKRGNGG